MAQTVSFFELGGIADPNTERFLLPQSLQSNNRDIRAKQQKKALYKGIHKCLTCTQRENVYLYYWKGLSKSDIAARAGISCSAVCKSLRQSQKALGEFVALYMEIWDDVWQEWERESNEGLAK
jgi:DNA-directed RNA polymerase specialized sigma subunit